MKHNITPTLLTITLLSSLTLCVPTSRAEPNPLSPVTRPTEEDLKAISFAVSAWDSTAKVGDPIYLKVVLKNTGKHPLIFSDRRKGGDEINYLISLERVGGKSPRLTERGLALYTPLHWERISELRHELKPGEAIEVTLDLTRIYEIKEPGEYKLQIKRYVYKPNQNKDLLIPILTDKITMKIQGK
jgi:hypothetical protein